MKMTLLVNFLVLFSINSFATDMFETINDKNLFADTGGWASGGGNALVCFSNERAAEQTRKNGNIITDDIIDQIFLIEMYDLVEAKIPRGLGQEEPYIIPIKDEESLISYVDRISNRFQFNVHVLQQSIFEGQRVLPNSNIRFYNGPVKQVDDIDTVIGSNLHKQCVISTMAIQRNSNDYFSLYIDKRLFNHPAHSKQSQAVLLLHEYLYTQSRKKGHTTSAATREAVSIAISKHSDYTMYYVAQAMSNLDFTFILDIEEYRSLGFLALTFPMDDLTFNLGLNLKNILDKLIDLKCNFDETETCKRFVQETIRIFDLDNDTTLFQALHVATHHPQLLTDDFNSLYNMINSLIKAELGNIIEGEISQVQWNVGGYQLSDSDKLTLKSIVDQFIDYLKEHILDSDNGQFVFLRDYYSLPIESAAQKIYKDYIFSKEPLIFFMKFDQAI